MGRHFAQKMALERLYEPLCDTICKGGSLPASFAGDSRLIDLDISSGRTWKGPFSPSQDHGGNSHARLVNSKSDRKVGFDFPECDCQDIEYSCSRAGQGILRD